MKLEEKNTPKNEEIISGVKRPLKDPSSTIKSRRKKKLKEEEERKKGASILSPTPLPYPRNLIAFHELIHSSPLSVNVSKKNKKQKQQQIINGVKRTNNQRRKKNKSAAA